MRTVIFLGLLYIGDSVNTRNHSPELLAFYGAIVIISATMDIVDFLR